MITGQVFQSITTDELARIADACGFSAEVEETGGKHWVWIRVAGRITLASIIGPDRGPRSIVLMLGVMSEIHTTADRANAFNRDKANWWTAYANDQSKPVLTMPFEVNGVTREHVAAKLFLWEYGMDEFLGYFG